MVRPSVTGGSTLQVHLEFTNRSDTTVVVGIDYSTFTAVDNTGQRYTAVRRDQDSTTVYAAGRFGSTTSLSIEFRPSLAGAATTLTIQSPGFLGTSPYSLTFAVR